MNLSLNRRTFLLGSIVAAAAPAITSRLAAQGPPADRRLRVGFLGAAHSHFRGKLPVIRKSPDFELIGVAEDSASVRAELTGDIPWIPRERLLKECEVVVIESAVEDHARHARVALEAGCHVHVEKPPATTLRELRQLLDLSAHRGRRLQVGYMWRYNPGINAAIEAARQGWLGSVVQVRAMMNTQVGADERAKWAKFRGGALFEHGCHLNDPIIRLMGRPSKITSTLQRTGAFPDTLADNCVAVYEFPHAVGILSNTPLQPNAGAHRFFEVIGTGGTARVEPLEQPILHLDLAKAAGPYSAGRQDITFPPYARYVDEFDALAKSIRNGTPLPIAAAEELVIHEALLRACRMS